MEQSYEIELKLRLINPDDYERILCDSALTALAGPGEPVLVEFDTVYYDTADLRLNKKGLSYRVRRSDRGFTATVKGFGHSRGGLHMRNEWNVSLPDGHPSLTAFADLPAGALLRETVGDAPLTELFRTRFTRAIMNITTAGGSRVEIGLDRGDVLSGAKKDPLCEIELELKDGQIPDLMELGAWLSQRWPLQPDNRSKYSRGIVLAEISADTP